MRNHGSGNLIQTLLKHDLVAEGTMPGGFALKESRISPSGVVASAYARAGEVKLGSFMLTGSSQEA